MMIGIGSLPTKGINTMLKYLAYVNKALVALVTEAGVIAAHPEIAQHYAIDVVMVLNVLGVFAVSNAPLRKAPVPVVVVKPNGLE